jgi:hypothetical protein
MKGFAAPKAQQTRSEREFNDSWLFPASLNSWLESSTTSKCRKKTEKVIAIMTVRDILSPIICQLNLSNRI